MEHAAIAWRAGTFRHAVGTCLFADFQRQPVADAFFSSELEVEHGILSGKLKSDLRGHKSEVFQARYPRVKRLEVFSDNPSDRQLMGLADSAYAICQSRNQASYWQAQGMNNLRVVEC